MASKGVINSGVLLGKGLAGLILYVPGTDEAQVITASKNGGTVGAVDVGTTAAIVAGTNPEGVYALVVNPADTATLGPIAFVSTGATDTVTIMARVVDFDPLLEGAVQASDLGMRPYQT